MRHAGANSHQVSPRISLPGMNGGELWIDRLIGAPAAALVMLGGRFWRGWLIQCARREIIDLPQTALEGPFAPAVATEWHNHAGTVEPTLIELSELQHRINSAYWEERIARKLCAGIACGALAVWPVGLALLSPVLRTRGAEEHSLMLIILLPAIAFIMAMAAVFAV